MSTPAVPHAQLGSGIPCGPPPGGAPGATVQVKSLRFGTLDVPSDRVVRFVRAVVGFDNLLYYAAIEDKESAPILWLQALGAPEVLLPAVDACRVTGSHSLELGDEEAQLLELEQAEDARVLFVLTLTPDPSGITVNLRAPIVWNTRRATAMQVVLQDPTLPVAQSLEGVIRERRSNKEVARAGLDTP